MDSEPDVLWGNSGTDQFFADESTDQIKDRSGGETVGDGGGPGGMTEQQVLEAAVSFFGNANGSLTVSEFDEFASSLFATDTEDLGNDVLALVAGERTYAFEVEPGTFLDPSETVSLVGTFPSEFPTTLANSLVANRPADGLLHVVGGDIVQQAASTGAAISVASNGVASQIGTVAANSASISTLSSPVVQTGAAFAEAISSTLSISPLANPLFVFKSLAQSGLAASPVVSTATAFLQQTVVPIAQISGTNTGLALTDALTRSIRSAHFKDEPLR
jgi:hypothetical protein